jgi:hypothetical protein
MASRKPFAFAAPVIAVCCKMGVASKRTDFGDLYKSVSHFPSHHESISSFGFLAIHCFPIQVFFTENTVEII